MKTGIKLSNENHDQNFKFIGVCLGIMYPGLWMTQLLGFLSHQHTEAWLSVFRVFISFTATFVSVSALSYDQNDKWQKALDKLKYWVLSGELKVK